MRKTEQCLRGHKFGSEDIWVSGTERASAYRRGVVLFPSAGKHALRKIMSGSCGDWEVRTVVEQRESGSFLASDSCPREKHFQVAIAQQRRHANIIVPVRGSGIAACEGYIRQRS